MAVPRLKRTTVWWIISLTLHLSLLVAIVVYSPLRAWLLREKTTEFVEPYFADAEMKQMVEQLRLTYRKRLARAVVELQAIHAEMFAIRDTKLDQLRAAQPKLVGRPDFAAAPEPDDEALLTEQPIADLYHLAVSIESQIRAGYEQVRAVELAQTQLISLDAAREVSRVAPVTRPDLRAVAIETPVHRNVQIRDPQYRDAVVDAIDPDDSAALRDRAIIELLFDAQLPVGRITNLRIREVDTKGKSAIVRLDKTQSRTIGLSQRTAEAVDTYVEKLRSRWVDPDDPVQWLLVDDRRQGQGVPADLPVAVAVRGVQGRDAPGRQRVARHGRRRPAHARPGQGPARRRRRGRHRPLGGVRRDDHGRRGTRR
jgi:hypothetical protein